MAAQVTSDIRQGMSKGRGRSQSRKARSSGAERSLAKTGSVALLSLTVVCAPLLVGGVLGWTIAVIALAASVAAGLALVAAYRELSVRPPLLVWFLGAGFVATVVHVINLPLNVVAKLSPPSLDLHSAAAGLSGTVADACPLSLDVGGTQTELVRWSALACCGIAAWCVCERLEAQRAVLRAIALAGGAAALASLVHGVLDAKAVFGLYVPKYSDASLGPLLNGNHLAGLMVLTAPLALGLAFSRHSGRARDGWLTLVGLEATVAFGTGSLGGIACLVLAIFAFFALSRRFRPLRSRIRWGAIGPTPIVVWLAGGAAAILRWQAPQPGSLEQKVDALRAGVAVLREAPQLGFGRGAYSTAFHTVSPARGRVEYAENLAIQWLTDWGLLIGGLLLALLAVCLYRGLRSSRNPAMLGAAVGASAITLQNLVDYSIELAGVGCVWAAALGAIATRRGAREANRAQAMAPIGVVAACALAVAFLGRQAHALDRETMAARLENIRSKHAFERAAAESLRAHPGDPHLILLIATGKVTLDHPDALRFVNRTMQLAPDWTGPHLLAAHWLRARGRLSQAAVEISEAARLDPTSALPIACEWLQQRPDGEEALAMAPLDHGRLKFLELLPRCRGLPGDLVAQIDNAILEIRPSHPQAVARRARAARAEGRLQEAEHLLRNSLAENPQQEELVSDLAHTLGESARVDEALSLVDKVLAVRPESTVLHRAKARLHALQGNADAMREAVAELRSWTPAKASLHAEVLAFEAQLELQLGNSTAALRCLEDAAKLTPNPVYLLRIARLAEKLDMPRRAQRAYDEILTITSDNPKFRAVHQAAQDRLHRAP